jgi:hypothetical protein
MPDRLASVFIPRRFLFLFAHHFCAIQNRPAGFWTRALRRRAVLLANRSTTVHGALTIAGYFAGGLFLLGAIVMAGS